MDPFISELFKTYGLPGLGLGVLGWAAWQFRAETALVRKELSEVWEARLLDWKATSEILQAVNTTIAALTAASESRNRTAEQQARSLDIAAVSHGQLVQEIVRLREEISSAKAEVAGLRSGFQR